jgi:prepilin-type N-terminal cleavage/methylation domain-containing protein
MIGEHDPAPRNAGGRKTIAAEPGRRTREAPPGPGGARCGSAGFTLMEILVAVVILALVVTTVLASFNMVFSTTGALSGGQALFEMGKNCLNRMALDLENITVAESVGGKPKAPDDPPEPFRFTATVETVDGTRFARIRFTSRAHVALEKAAREGIAEIVYYVQARRDGGFRLRRADHLYPYPARFEERAADPVLCENVKSLAAVYFAEDGTESETWDSESEQFGMATPVMVALRLEIGEGEERALFETIVRPAMARKKKG